MDIVKEILNDFIYQIIFTVGVIVLFGLLIALCRRGFCRLLGRAGPKVLLITGIVGTPIHELSHALMCLVFGHKIEEMRLYSPSSSDGSLGYVSHSFNQRNLYHQIGNFFIGIAPVVGGSGVLLLLSLIMVPDVFSNVAYILSDIGTAQGITELFSAIGEIFISIFDFSNAQDVLWWIFILLALMISSHMELSSADIKGSIKGLLLLCALLLAADVLVGIISLSALETVTAVIVAAGIALASFLVISGVFSLVLLAIALVIKLFGLIFSR